MPPCNSTVMPVHAMNKVVKPVSSRVDTTTNQCYFFLYTGIRLIHGFAILKR